MAATNPSASLRVCRWFGKVSQASAHCSPGHETSNRCTLKCRSRAEQEAVDRSLAEHGMRMLIRSEHACPLAYEQEWHRCGYYSVSLDDEIRPAAPINDPPVTAVALPIGGGADPVAIQRCKPKLVEAANRVYDLLPRLARHFGSEQKDAGLGFAASVTGYELHFLHCRESATSHGFGITGQGMQYFLWLEVRGDARLTKNGLFERDSIYSQTLHSRWDPFRKDDISGDEVRFLEVVSLVEELGHRNLP